jgi:integrase
VAHPVESNCFLRWRNKRKGEGRKGTRREADGTGATTLNHYLETMRAMLNWCVGQKRIASNELADVDKVQGEKRWKRRALTDEQVTALMSVVPAKRKMFYRVAMALGLRRLELEKLVWGDLQLLAIRPHVQLRAEATKARRGDQVPIPPTLAADLRAERPEGASDADRVFPRVPSLDWWKHDLAAAKIPYMDDMGRVVDFHAGTRKTLCTRMHRAGVPLATAMRIMRHTDARLTMVDYADDGQLGGELLPELTAGQPPATDQAAAG